MPIDERIRSAGRFRLRSLIPNRIDLYLLTEVLGPTSGGIIFFTFVFLLFQSLRLAEFIITHKAYGLVLFEIVGAMMITFLPAVIPISFLIGVIVGFGRLSADSELVALKAGGISIGRLSIPVILASLAASALSLGLGLDWGPTADRIQADAIARIANTKIVDSIEAGTFHSDFFDLLIFAEEKDEKTDRLKNVFIYDERDSDNPLVIVAREGEIITAISKSELGAAVVLRLFEGNIHRTGYKSEKYQKVDFGEYRVYLEVEGESTGSKARPKNMTSSMIRERIEDLRAKPDSAKVRKKIRVLASELWKRLAIALSPIVFGFLGIGFGTLRTRAVRAGAALISFIVVMVYYFILIAAQGWSARGDLPPEIALNLPNLFFAFVAWRAMKSAAW
jgi:lipopolysaccharide export system permease protein